ncbi:hypothetical protein ACQBAR_03560 [Propionibacteriaceae bacterium Y1685]
MALAATLGLVGVSLGVQFADGAVLGVSAVLAIWWCSDIHHGAGTSIPASWRCLGVSIAAWATHLAVWCASWSTLPTPVPTHASISSGVDRWAESPLLAAGVPLGLLGVILLAMTAHVRRLDGRDQHKKATEVSVVSIIVQTLCAFAVLALWRPLAPWWVWVLWASVVACLAALTFASIRRKGASQAFHRYECALLFSALSPILICLA